MNISEHTNKFIQEAKRRGYGENTIKNYVSNLNSFFAWTTKDHPKNINEDDIKRYLAKFIQPKSDFIRS